MMRSLIPSFKDIKTYTHFFLLFFVILLLYHHIIKKLKEIKYFNNTPMCAAIHLYYRIAKQRCGAV